MSPHDTTQRPTVRRPRRTWRTWLVLAAALLVGVGIGVGPSLLRGSSSSASSGLRVDRHRSVQTLHLPGTGTALSPTELQARLQPITPAAPTVSKTPIAAITTFFDAQIGSQQDAAYDVLSDADRKRYPTAAIWASRRPQIVPDVVGYTIGAFDQHPHRATVAVQLRLRASLDETIGLVPADADATVVVVHEHNNWRVAVRASDINFRYLSTATLTTAARQWIAARQHCEVSQQWRKILYGEGADNNAQSLCNTTTPAVLDGTSELAGRTDTASLIAAFGPKVGIWARVVSVHAPKQFDLVLAPVGQQWLVIGVLPSLSNQGQG